jgi:hypothetical protein
LAFLLWPPSRVTHYAVQNDVIPIIIDFWPEHVAMAETIFSRVPLLFVTNIEMKECLDRTTLAAKTHYVPLSVSARHICRDIPSKTLDLIQVGRRNRLLHDWALRYVAERPSLDYLFVGDLRGYTPQWISTKRGPIDFDNSRDTYMKLLKSARISLVSSPGIDGGENRTGGFNPVTPRFYESAAARCQLIGRFPAHGKDMIENRVASVCRRVLSFDDFVCTVNDALISRANPRLQNEFLRGHVSSDIARAVARILRDCGFKSSLRSNS